MSENKTDYGIKGEIEETSDDIVDLGILIDVFGDKLLDGMDSVSDVIGKIHALGIVGIEPQDALDYVLQLQALEHEKYVLDENNKMQTEVSKVKGIQSEKMEM